MIEMIMVIAAGVLLLPVLFFLPTAMSIKNKMILLAVSLILASAGLFAADLLSYWTAALAIVGLAFIAAYLAEKRMPASAEALSASKESAVSEWDDSLYDFRDNTSTDRSLELSEEEPVAEDILEAEEVIAAELIAEPKQVEEEIEVITEEIADNAEQIEEAPVDLEMENLLIAEETLLAQTEEPASPDLLEDDLEFLLENREQLDAEEETIQHETSELAENRDWLEEIEDLNQPVHLEQQMEVNEPGTLQAEEMQELEEIAELEVIQEMEELEENLEPLEKLPAASVEGNTAEEQVEAEKVSESIQTEEVIELAPVEWISEDIELEEITEQPAAEESITEGTEEPMKEELEELTSELTEEELPAVEPMMEDEPSLIDSEEHSQPDMDTSVREMLLETLEHYQKQGDEASRHEMLSSILAQPLSDMDYYIFSRQLVESGLVREDYRGTETVLESMRTRLADYIIIQEEINDYFSILHTEKSIVQ
ncbi:hypothetical protein ACFFJY_03645 [Fictibacillus aquaticus]|uniref:Uncharacterized protein n=1 Tax=Fictibacillus aquaticus TaxID=2021314 RepID=A0A235FFJ7_9BACL|nr:hypothetical protein [Fictibacillus aquaticus]OYD59734.1 hypothetical protein CGZ90_07595 [Fictibacillus aquaticus]